MMINPLATSPYPLSPCSLFLQLVKLIWIIHYGIDLGLQLHLLLLQL
jgi:hypothetical protein